MSGVLYVPYTPLQIPSCPAFPQGELRDYPLVNSALYYNNQTVDFYSVIDSGADHCSFPSIYAPQVGLNVQSGKKSTTFGATGSGDTFYHNIHVGVTIQGQPYGFDCYAGFMDGLNAIGIGLLGRCGFFDLFEKVAFCTATKMVELTLKS